MTTSQPTRGVGFPRLHKEPGERRDFLPDLIRHVARLGAPQVAVERGYGSGMDIPESDYRSGAPAVEFTSLEACFQQDVVVVLRWPADELVRSMRPGSILLTMAHFPTRPARVALLKGLGVRCVSLDCLKDGLGRRWVENLAAVGWNGVRAAFGELAGLLPGFGSPDRDPIRVTVMGAGAVGAHAVRAASCYGDPSRRAPLAKHWVPGVEVTVIDYDLTCHRSYMRSRLARTDLLVDATYRPDASEIIIPNDWLAVLPEHAVLLDLCVDPYLPDQTPPQVKGVEGMPEGNLDQYVFAPNDPAWDRLPPGIRTDHRRTALSCYSWPGVDPRGCMELYGRQIQPILDVIVTQGVEHLDPAEGTEAERAVAGAELQRY